MTRLLGQSPSGLSATGESDIRNYYDMIAARQELDLRPQLERLDRLICWSEDIDEGALTFAFRPLWQLDEPAKAALALAKAQATQVYAGLKLWPDAVMAKLAEAQLVADGVYPNAAAVFADATVGDVQAAIDAFPVRPGFDPAQPRAPDGRWTAEGGSTSARSIVPAAQHINEDPDPTPEEAEEELEEKFKAREDPQRFFRFGPDPNGIFRVPLMPGGGGAQTIKAPPLGGVSRPPTGPVETEPNVEPRQASRPDIPKPDLPLRLGDPSANTPSFRPTEPISPTARSSGSGPAGAGPSGPVAPTTLESIKVPAGLKLEAHGKTAVEQGKLFAEQVRKALNFDPAPKANKPGDTEPDGILRNPETGEKTALEVKYLGPGERGLHDPDRMIDFINDKDVAQARKYLRDFKGGLLWVVNNEELIYKYDYIFRRSGLSGVRIVCVPSQ